MRQQQTIGYKEETQQNLNSNYQSKTLVLKYADSFITFLLCSIGLLVKYKLIFVAQSQS